MIKLFRDDLVFVKGISQRGKNRVNEHGAVWKVKKTTINDGVLLESTDGTQYWRWVEPLDDVDFDIVHVLNPDLEQED